jgi:Glyoxalase/Bleomycin resistance protein/Dioxygenase superfamily
VSFEHGYGDSSMQSIPHGLFQQAWPEGEFRLFQLGFVVDDLVEAATQWARVFGVGPFHVLPPIEVPCTYRGTESAIDVQVALAQAGPVQIELINQRCNRASVYRDLVDKGESGFHQLCTVTPDYDGKKAHYERLGYELASELTTPDGQRVAYFDTVDDFGFFTEVVEEASAFLAQLAEIAQTCADWDGRDPVRVLTRHGYRTP